MSDERYDGLDLDEDFSLESILAEYKGEAFIAGQKKSAKSELDTEAEQILDSAISDILGESRKVTEGRQAKKAEAEKSVPSAPQQRTAELVRKAETQTAQPAPAAQSPAAPEADQPKKREQSPAPAQPKPKPASTPVEQRPVVQPGTESALDDQETVRFDLSGHGTWTDNGVSQPEAEAEPASGPVENERPVEREMGKVIQIPFARKNRHIESVEAEDMLDAELPEELLEDEQQAETRQKKGRISRMRRKKSDEQTLEPDLREFTDSTPAATDFSDYANTDAVKDYTDLGIDESAFALEEEEEGIVSGFLGRLAERREARQEKKQAEAANREAEPESDEAEYDQEDFAPDEMTIQEAALKYGKGINSYQMRGSLSIFFSLIMLLLTAIHEGGGGLPGPFGTDQGFAGGMLLLQLFVMFIGVELIVTGITDILRLRPGVETLITVAAIASAVDAVIAMRGIEHGIVAPYSPVVAFAIGCGLLGTKMVRNAMKISLRTAATGASPYVVTSKYGALDEGYVLFKSHEGTEGFLRKTQQIDFSELAYTRAAPLFILASAVFSVLAVVGGSAEPVQFVHYFAAMTAVSASFTGLLAYGLPYSMLAKKLMKAGAALAGWGGASEVDAAAGVVVTDGDVFPVGTLSLSGVRVFRKADTQKVVSYTASMIAASGSGLTEVFTEIVRKQKYAFFPVEDLSCYEGGGIGATVGGDEVIVGSANFMNLMGIRLPQSLNVKNAVFTAVNGDLAGIFAINYVPISSVQEALVSILHTKIQPMFAVRDFNVTPLMLQQKFKISTDKIDFLTYEERYALSALQRDERARPFAVLNREGLGPLTDIVVGGKRLRTSVMVNTVLCLLSSVIGLVLMLSFFWTGSPQTASVVNVFAYMAAWLLVTVVLSRGVTSD